MPKINIPLTHKKTGDNKGKTVYMYEIDHDGEKWTFWLPEYLVDVNNGTICPFEDWKIRLQRKKFVDGSWETIAQKEITAPELSRIVGG